MNTERIFGSCSALVRTDDSGDKFGRNSFVIDGKFVNGNIAGQVLLVNPTKRPQEISQPGPAAFIGIDMHFSNAIAIVIAAHSF